jgi:hypothetical protein
MTRHLLFVLAATSALAGAHAGDFDYKAYRPSSLTDAVAEHHKNPAVDFLVETGNFKYAVGGTYTGRHRQTAAPTKELIRRWVKALRHPKEYETLFEHEVEVESGGKKYWFPIQNPMVQSFASEVRADSSVKVYIMLLGATKDTWVFAINEFQRQ